MQAEKPYNCKLNSAYNSRLLSGLAEKSWGQELVTSNLFLLSITFTHDTVKDFLNCIVSM